MKSCLYVSEQSKKNLRETRNLERLHAASVKLSAATARLIALVDHGMEFPRAHWKVCCEFQLTEKEASAIVKLYDQAS